MYDSPLEELPKQPQPKLPWYLRFAERHEPNEIITANDEGSPYLYRWHIIPKNRFLNVYLHRFVGPDKRHLHDHPWVSLAYMLEGEFLETFYKPGPNHPDVIERLVEVRTIKKGSWTYRNSRFLHYLAPGPEGAWTIFITGPKLRKWGFITEYGWRPWNTVLAHKSKGGY